MIEKPHTMILSREEFPKFANEHFGENLQLLREIVNYGTNMIPRCFNSSGTKIEDVVILVSMFKYAVTLIDSIEIQLSQSAIESSFVTIRALWEIELYIEWALKQDTKRRATMYLVYELRQQLAWEKVSIQGTPEQTRFLRGTQDSETNFELEQYADEHANSNIQIIEGKLNTEECVAENQEFDNFEQNNRSVRNWFSLTGANNIRELAKALGREAEYVVNYNSLCRATHGQVFSDQVRFENERVIFEPVRDFVRMPEALRYAYNFSLRLYRLVLGYYRHEELENFSRKYQEEWRERIWSVPLVKYENGNYVIERGKTA